MDGTGNLARGMDQNQRQLVEACLRGDQAALAAMHGGHAPAVAAYLRRSGFSDADAEDLTQETFLSASREIRHGSVVDEPERWIFGLARHRLVDHFRAQEREGRRLRLAWQAEEATDRVAEARSLSREQARAALDEVPPAQRLALTLRYLDGLTVPETATAIGRSVRATESLLVRGRESFRRAYQEVAR